MSLKIKQCEICKEKPELLFKVIMILQTENSKIIYEAFFKCASCLKKMLLEIN